ncbi:hypothetical protein [Bizionia sp. APA-3]|nr:hypothetical protein [Bizionia sp. APA-3]OBX17746.1 hypothetical protein BAA08_15900 [Bizionia sp. APA-3]
MVNTHHTINDENSKNHQRQKALKALALAKQLEAKKLKAGATHTRIDKKTFKLNTDRMAVEIQQFHDNEVLVNNKLIIQDQEGVWKAKIELTNAEQEAFNKHIQSQ